MQINLVKPLNYEYLWNFQDFNVLQQGGVKMECNFNEQMTPQWFNFYINCARSSRYRGLSIVGCTDPKSIIASAEEFFDINELKVKQAWQQVIDQSIVRSIREEKPKFEYIKQQYE